LIVIKIYDFTALMPVVWKLWCW